MLLRKSRISGSQPPAPSEMLRPSGWAQRLFASRPLGLGAMPRNQGAGCRASLTGLGCAENGNGKHGSANPCWVQGQSQGHGWCVRSSRRKAYLAQCDGAGGQADEPTFPAVGVLRQGKLLRQGLDHMLDLHRVVLGHELSDQPGEREERVLGQWDQAAPAPAAGPRAWHWDEGCRGPAQKEQSESRVLP